ncbi:hypothetical protein pipiens_004803 [Culex pipiens pipiens]|uniref:Acyltransferase 3 domain-containing protein n=1 Tax=Culex pipiens pipiens TaxID=38569 RepID=A0ABD1CER2_CULPP
MARLLNTSDQPPNLPFLEGIRIILTVLVLVAHANTAVLRTPLTNPEDIELQNNSFFFPLINSLNTHVISMFFTVAGMVQADSFLSAIDKSVGRIQVGFVLKKIFRRLANLVPAYAFVIFYQATLFPRSKLTPVGYKHQDYCDRHWWTNLLFINNYVHADEPCMKFGWYLGVDFQLFLFSAAIMMIIWRFPRIKMLCTYLMIASSLALPAIEIYKEKLDATSTFNMKHALTDYLSYEGYLKNYAPTTVNAGYYFIGMISGFTYHHINKHEHLHFKAFSYSSKLITSITPIFLAINGILLVLSSLPKPSIILALYGSALKAIWSIANGSLLLYLALRSKTRIIALLAHPKLRVLTRLSFCVYIVQLSVVYTFYSHLSVPITNNASHAIYVTSVISFVSCASGLLLYLAVQAPCTILLNRLIDRMFAKREIARRKTDKIL